jgi:hypothetical protein
MPQVRGAIERFISRIFPHSRTVIRTGPLEALIIGGYVRGLSDRDLESLPDGRSRPRPGVEEHGY